MKRVGSRTAAAGMSLPRLKGGPAQSSTIDRLHWVEGISFIAYGVRVGIRVNQGGALERLRSYLPVGWKPTVSPYVDRLYSITQGQGKAHSGGRNLNCLYGDKSLLFRSLKLETLLERLESEATLYVADRARGRVFVHAGVVGWRGRAILIPGRSFSGKSTLVASLVRAGANFYSDEYAVLDSRGRVHPYPRPLALRKNGEYQQRRYSVQELGGVPGVRPLPVGLVVVSKYKPGVQWRPRRLSAGRGALALLDNTVSARSGPANALIALRQVVLNAPVIKGDRGEAADLVDYLLNYSVL